MSNPVSDMIGRLPIAITTYILSSGALFLILSPTKYYLNTFYSGLFNVFNSTDNIIAFFIFALSAGVPLFLIKEFISGEDGLNHRIAEKRRNIFKRKSNDKSPNAHSQETPHPTSGAFDIPNEKFSDFNKWLRETGLIAQVDLSNIQDFLVTAILVASEISIIFHLLTIFSLIFRLTIISTSYDFTNDLLIALIIFTAILFFDKCYFRKTRKRYLRKIGEAYLDIYDMKYEYWK